MSLPAPPPIRRKKEEEEKKRKRKEKAEAHLYTIIKVARDEDLGEQIGKEIYFDLVDHDKVRTFRIQKQMPFTQFKEEIAKELGIPVQFQRYWLWAKRQNRTYRPNHALTAQEEIQSVDQLRGNYAELKLFLEVDLFLDLRPFPPLEKTKKDILLFFKLYDPLKEKIRYVGRLFVKERGKPLEILTKLNELAGFSPDEEIELFEEIKFEPNVMCERIDVKLSFRGSQIEDGDIICFQKSLRNQCSEQYRFPEVPSFLEYVHDLQFQIRLKKEQEEKEQKRKEKVEDRLYTIIKVARDEDLGEQIGKEIYFDLVDHDKVRSFLIQKQMPFTQFKEEVAKELGIPIQFQRYWIWAKRQNHTYRPDHALTAQEETQSVGQLRDGNNAELKLFLEIELCPDLRPFPPPEKTKEDILLFFKLYDPLKEKIRYVGRLFVKESGKPLEILTKLNELVGYSPDEEIELFEEIKFEPNVMCERIDSKLSFRDCEIGDGDIICFQKSLRNHRSEQYRFPDVPSFLKYVHNQSEEQEMNVPCCGFPTKRPRPIEVAPVGTASVVDVQAVDDPVSVRFTWTIKKFSRLKVKKWYSDVFNVGGYKWRILIFPKGNTVDCLSIYLDVADSASLPSGWSKYAQFSLAVHNQLQNKFTVRKDAEHQFNERARDFGFPSFMLLSELYHLGKGYIMNDTVIIEADVTVRKAN